MLTGRCLCARVRIEVRGALGPPTFCHCSSCRRASGTAFATNASLGSDGLHWVSGRELISEYESSPGKFRAFCSACGSPLYARHANQPDRVSIRLGVLEDDPGVRPRAHFNVGSKAPWFEITDALPQYPEDTETDAIRS